MVVLQPCLEHRLDDGVMVEDNSHAQEVSAALEPGPQKVAPSAYGAGEYERRNDYQPHSARDSRAGSVSGATCIRLTGKALHVPSNVEMNG